MKKLILFTLLLIPIGLFAQGGVLETVGDFLDQYFATAAVFIATVMTVTQLLKDKFNIGGESLSYIVTAVLGVVGIITGAGVFGEETLLNSIVIIVTSLLSAGKIYDKFLKKPDVAKLDSAGHPIK